MLGSSGRRASNDPLLVQNCLSLPPIHPVDRRQAAVIRLSIVMHVSDLFLEKSILPPLQFLSAFVVRHRPDLGCIHDISVVTEESGVATLDPLLKKVKVVNRFSVPSNYLLAIVSFRDCKCLKVFRNLEFEIFEQLGILDASRHVRVERFLELCAVPIPELLNLVDGHKLHLGHPVIRPLFLELKGFSGRGSFPTQANDTRQRDANLHEILEELVERMIRIATDKDPAVCLVMKDLSQQRSNEGFTGSYSS